MSSESDLEDNSQQKSADEGEGKTLTIENENEISVTWQDLVRILLRGEKFIMESQCFYFLRFIPGLG